MFFFSFLIVIFFHVAFSEDPVGDDVGDFFIFFEYRIVEDFQGFVHCPSQSFFSSVFDKARITRTSNERKDVLRLGRQVK